MEERLSAAFQATALRWVRVEHHAQLFMTQMTADTRYFYLSDVPVTAAVELLTLPRCG